MGVEVRTAGGTETVGLVHVGTAVGTLGQRLGVGAAVCVEVFATGGTETVGLPDSRSAGGTLRERVRPGLGDVCATGGTEVGVRGDGLATCRTVDSRFLRGFVFGVPVGAPFQLCGFVGRVRILRVRLRFPGGCVRRFWGCVRRFRRPIGGILPLGRIRCTGCLFALGFRLAGGRVRVCPAHFLVRFGLVRLDASGLLGVGCLLVPATRRFGRVGSRFFGRFGGPVTLVAPLATVGVGTPAPGYRRIERLPTDRTVRRRPCRL